MPSTLQVVVGVVLALVAYQQLVVVPQNDQFLDIQNDDAIVVTGSHTGIGKHAALTLAQQGFVVFCGVRKVQEHGDELMAAAKKYGIDATKLKPLLLDVTKPEQVAAAVETVRTYLDKAGGDASSSKGLYGLFNNAGIGPSHPNGLSVEHFPMDEYRWTFEVNYFGLLQTTKAFLPLLRRGAVSGKGGGRIVSNTSIAGFFSGPFASAYAGSKFAVEALMDSLRRELYPHGVSVSVLQPGYITTPIFQQVDKIKTFNPAGVYAETEKKMQRQFGKGALDYSMSPRVTSQAVVHAMRAAKPRTRYCVGGLSTFVRLLSMLPDAWADALLRWGENQQGITDAEIDRLLETSHDKEFEF